MHQEHLQTDVLVIGSGAAACMAALESVRHGAGVLMVDQGRLGRSGSTTTAGAGTAAAFGHTVFGEPGNPDTPEQQYEDMLSKGRYLSNPDLLRDLVHDIRPLVERLCILGVPYLKTQDGLFIQNQGVGQTYARNCTPKGNGAALTEILIKELSWRKASFLEKARVVKLICESGRVKGALAISIQQDKVYVIEAGSVILAGGSATSLHKYASAAFKTTGDSYWLACDAGAELANMEFLEFTFVPLIQNRAVPCGGSTQLTSRGARFYNADGERFMKRYNPETLEKTTRAVLIHAFYREMIEARGPVFMDCASISPDLWQKWEAIGHNFINFMKAAKVDYRSDKIVLVPALHCLLGGIIIDNSGRTSTEGLFAAGEASTGIHGAVRLGGSAFAECYVFGTRAGRQAAREALSSKRSDLGWSLVRQHLDNFFRDGKPVEISKIRERMEDLQNQAWQSLGVIRNADDLEEGRDFFSRLLAEQTQWQKRDLKTLNESITFRNLAYTALACTGAALARKESRGGHIREDYPNENDDYIAWFVNDHDDPGKCRKQPVPGLKSKTANGL